MQRNIANELEEMNRKFSCDMSDMRTFITHEIGFKSTELEKRLFEQQSRLANKLSGEFEELKHFVENSLHSISENVTRSIESLFSKNASLENEVSEINNRVNAVEGAWRLDITACQNAIQTESKNYNLMTTELRSVISAEITSRRKAFDTLMRRIDSDVSESHTKGPKLSPTYSGLGTKISAVTELSTALETRIEKISILFSERMNMLQSSTRKVVGSIRKEIQSLNERLATLENIRVEDNRHKTESSSSLSENMEALSKIVTDVQLSVQQSLSTIFTEKEAIVTSTTLLGDRVRASEMRTSDCVLELNQIREYFDSERSKADVYKKQEKDKVQELVAALVEVQGEIERQKLGSSAVVDSEKESTRLRLQALEENMSALSELEEVSTRLFQDNIRSLEVRCDVLNDSVVQSRYEYDNTKRHIDNIVESINKQLAEKNTTKATMESDEGGRLLGNDKSSEKNQEIVDRLSLDLTAIREGVEEKYEVVRKDMIKLDHKIRKSAKELEQRILAIVNEEAGSNRSFVLEKIKEEEAARDEAIIANSTQIHTELAEILLEIENRLGFNEDETTEEV